MKFEHINTTLGISRSQVTNYKPESIEALKNIFPSLRSQYSNISVISTGNNWGYGDGAPAVDNSLVINLSKCNRIIEFDSYHGLVTLEPGVTYGQLAEFLKTQNSEWIAPVHGGGPDCSVVGNALERGYGITPHADHFSAVQSLSAILNNGELYQGSLKNLGQDKLDKLYRYGIGPYTDGLFTQSGLGVVTEMTIRLASKPPHVEMFYFNLLDDSQFLDLVEAIKIKKRQLGSVVGGINLINKERCLSMVIDYPENKIQSGEPLDEQEIKLAAEKYLVTNWLVVGMMYGEKSVVKAAKKIVLNNFAKIKLRKFFFNTTNKGLFAFISKFLNFAGKKDLSTAIEKLFEAYNVLTGIPNNIALKLAYWKNPDRSLLNQENLNPFRDKCGLIWYAPLVEMKSDVVVDYIRFIQESSKKFNLNALITLTTVDDLCFDSTIPILFNRESKEDSARAFQFYQHLLKEGAQKGFFPYRLNIETQKELNIQNPYLKLDAVNPERYK
jgi:4-cresol dehydrogenase (hydroxylating)